MIVTVAGKVLEGLRRQRTVGRIRDEDIAEAIKPTTQRVLCSAEFDAEVRNDLGEESLELWCDPLLDRRVRCVVCSKRLVEVLYFGYRAIWLCRSEEKAPDKRYRSIRSRLILS